MSDYVIDASVALKWILPETDSHNARTYISQNHTLVAPMLIIAECANIFGQETMKGTLTLLQAKSGLSFITQAFSRLERDDAIASHTLELAIILKHSVYDALYLACALVNNCQLVIADKKFRDKVLQTTPEFASMIILLNQS